MVLTNFSKLSYSTESSIDPFRYSSNASLPFSGIITRSKKPSPGSAWGANLLLGPRYWIFMSSTNRNEPLILIPSALIVAHWGLNVIMMFKRTLTARLSAAEGMSSGLALFFISWINWGKMPKPILSKKNFVFGSPFIFPQSKLFILFSLMTAWRSITVEIRRVLAILLAVPKGNKWMVTGVF